MKNRVYRKSSSFKVAVLFTVFLGISDMLLWYFIYDFGNQYFVTETEAAIDLEIKHIESLAKNDSNNSVGDYISSAISDGTKSVYLYQDNDDIKISGNIAKITSAALFKKNGISGFDISSEHITKIVAAKTHILPNGYKIFIGRDITHIIGSYERLKIFSYVIMGLMFFVVFISFYSGVLTVRRINKIADIAQEIITTGNLSRRIHVDKERSDLCYLSNTLNSLLDKTEDLMQGIKDVSDNIAHDLRTPITRLRSKLEALQNKKSSTKDIDNLVVEADGILNIFNSLLRITKIQKNTNRQEFKDVDIKSVLSDVVELYEPLADQKNIVINKDFAGEMLILGNRSLLFQMFANIVDNSIKFSQNDCDIFISIKSKNEKCEVVISDRGVGIESQDIKKVFDRFYRADKSRNTEGTGLGLSMVKAIADLHNSTIKLEKNTHSGLKVSLMLPSRV